MNERTVIEKILANYGIRPAVVQSRQMGYRNRSFPIRRVNGQMLNLIIYKSDSDILNRIQNANRISNCLAGHGFPTRHTQDTRIITIHSQGKTRYGSLYNYLPGTTIPWEAYTQKHLKLLGATLGLMHTSMRVLEKAKLPLVTDEYQAILKRVHTYFAAKNVTRAAELKLEIELPTTRIARYTRLLDTLIHSKQSQPLHMDFVRSNILFRNASDKPQISGILDFEKTAWGHPVFDVARTLAFLLVDSRYKSVRQVRKYFLYSGYHKRGDQPVPNHRMLEELIDMFLIHDLYKFMRHNPYESLVSNEHYIRTRDLLMHRGIIRRVQISQGLHEG